MSKIRKESLLLKSRGRLKRFALRLAKELPVRQGKEGGEIALTGPLGAGKTTFVRFLAEALGSGDRVSSPSYVLQNIYDCPGGISLEHWDLYRLQAIPEELLEPPLPGVLRLIEWADRDAALLDRVGMQLQFEFGEKCERFLTVLCNEDCS